MPLPFVKQIGPCGERILYRIAGLPVACRGLLTPDRRSGVHSAYAHYYWTPDGAVEWLELAAALVLWPFVLVLSAIWFTLGNGKHIAARSGRPAARQLIEQIACYFSAGILPPWYYIFSLHDRDVSAATRFINRFETKRGAYRLLARHTGQTSPLADKAAFAQRCAAAGLSSAPIIGLARDGRYAGGPLPRHDLFVKPITGRGGRGAERWDHIGAGAYRHETRGVMNAAELCARLARESKRVPRLVQPRLVNHAALASFSNGALATVRALTCLDEVGRPELVAAVFRMATGANRTVDNIHAGGIAAAIDLRSGRLSAATDLGMDATLGWLDRHPDTGASIAGTALPGWDAVRRLALDAHAAFADRICIGWDIALIDTGACLVEGNGAPDVDLMQRPMRRGLATARFGTLLAYHLEAAERHRAAAIDEAHRRPRKATT